MKNYDSAIFASINNEQSALFYLLEMQFADTYYYTDCDIDLVWDNHKYETRGFALGNIQVSSDMAVDSIDVEVDNADLSMSAIVLGEDVSGLPIILSMCTISGDVGATTGIIYDTAGTPLRDTADEYITDTTGNEVKAFQPMGLQPLFRGYVNNYGLFENKLRLGVVNELALWNKRTLRPATASCPWEVNGTECTLTGATCNQTYANCLTNDNVANFGGFRFLPSIMETNVWWGRRPEK